MSLEWCKDDFKWNIGEINNEKDIEDSNLNIFPFHLN